MITPSLFQMYILPIFLGIGTTICVFLCKDFFFHSFLPRYKEWTYHGHDATGKWEANFPATHDEGIVCNEVISVQQLSEVVWGDIRYTEIRRSDNKRIREKRFEFKGTYTDSVLSASYRNTNRTEKGCGTFCLVSTKADVFTGKYSWLDPDTNRVEADDYVWKKIRR